MQERIKQQREQVSNRAPLRQSSDRELLAAFVGALLKQGEAWRLQTRVIMSDARESQQMRGR